MKVSTYLKKYKYKFGYLQKNDILLCTKETPTFAKIVHCPEPDLILDFKDDAEFIQVKVKEGDTVDIPVCKWFVVK